MLIYAIVLILVMLATNNPTLRGMVERIIPRGKGGRRRLTRHDGKQKRAATRMVPAPSHGIIPERDFNERPVLEARNLGIDFGGLHAVEDFNLIIGKTEIAGLIGPNGAARPPCSTC